MTMPANANKRHARKDGDETLTLAGLKLVDTVVGLSKITSGAGPNAADVKSVAKEIKKDLKSKKKQDKKNSKQRDMSGSVRLLFASVFLLFLPNR